MDIKETLSSTGIKTKEVRFLKPPSLPYIVYHDTQIIRSSDIKFVHDGVLVKDHSVIIELYIKSLEDDLDNIKKVEAAINTFLVDYTREIEWVEEKEHFKISYELEKRTKEKIGVNNE